LASALEASRNAWFVVSATECAASASSVVEPLIRPPASLVTAISAFAASASSAVVRLAPARCMRGTERRLTC
jgi:hypothetical protein